MKKWILILIGIMVAAMMVTGFMYSQGADVIDDDVMYMVSHSEYWSGEEGQIIARLYNWQGNPITVDNCTVDVYYPDKTLFITDGITDDSLQATTGTHYYNFTTPATEGVYQYYATCNYNGNSRTVANSFHLSPALNFQLNINDSITTLTAAELAHYITVTGNLTTIRDELIVVDGNVDQVLLDIFGMNTTVNGIDVNVDEALLRLLQVNGTVNSIETKVDTLDGNVDEILVNLTTMDGKIDVLAVNLTTIRNELATVDGNVDTLLTNLGLVAGDVTQLLTDVAAVKSDTVQIISDVGGVQTDTTQIISDVADVQTDTTAIRNDMMYQDNITIITDGQAGIVNNLTAIQQFCNTTVTSDSQLCTWVSAINDQVVDINITIGTYTDILNEINTTTHSTYDYMTGTLATNVNNIFGVNQQINGTVNRIEEATTQINGTVNTLETNQEAVVYMEVTS